MTNSRHEYVPLVIRSVPVAAEFDDLRRNTAFAIREWQQSDALGILGEYAELGAVRAWGGAEWELRARD